MLEKKGGYKMNIIMDQLHNAVLKKGPVCVGLDPKEAFFPEYLRKKDGATSEKLFEFNKKIIDATFEDCACFKLQIACYEAFGVEGMIGYSKTVQYLKQNKLLSIGDIKRGDIASSAEMYAKGHFDGDFQVDIITINPYMGEDAVSPYYKYIKERNKGLFILIRTSNSSSTELQELIVDDEPVFLKTAKLTEKWGKDFIGENGFSAIGGVIGLTYPEEMRAIKDELPNMFFLIPGYGAQGGTGRDAALIIGQERCGVVNSSRKIICAHKGINETESFSECAFEAARKMKEDILKWL